MEQMSEEAFDEILERIDRSRRRWDGSTTYQVGPFTLDPEYARLTLGATTVAGSDVRELVRYANEAPPWSSITDALLVEWNELEWIVEREPALTSAVADAGLTVSTNPLLIRRPSDAAPDPVPIGAKVRSVDPESDLRGLIAAWRLSDLHPSGRARPLTRRKALKQVRLAAASVTDDEVARWERYRDAGLRAMVVLVRGTIVGAGMHEPSVDGSEITNLAVLPAFRRRGFGTALAAALAADAFARGIDLLFVESAPEAATMYERAGFRLIGAIGRVPLGS